MAQPFVATNRARPHGARRAPSAQTGLKAAYFTGDCSSASSICCRRSVPARSRSAIACSAGISRSGAISDNTSAYTVASMRIFPNAIHFVPCSRACPTIRRNGSTSSCPGIGKLRPVPQQPDSAASAPIQP